MAFPPQAPINPMQGGAGSSPAAGGPPPPMGQPAGQLGASPPALGRGSQPGMPQTPGNVTGPAEILAKAQAALRAGQITQQQFDLIVQKLKMAMGGAVGGPPGAAAAAGPPGRGPPPPAAAQPAITSATPSPAWGQ